MATKCVSAAWYSGRPKRALFFDQKYHGKIAEDVKHDMLTAYVELINVAEQTIGLDSA
jgi:hypothetical protein